MSARKRTLALKPRHEEPSSQAPRRIEIPRFAEEGKGPLPRRTRREASRWLNDESTPLFADDENFRQNETNDLVWKIAYRAFAFALSASIAFWCFQSDDSLALAVCVIGIAIVCLLSLKR